MRPFVVLGLLLAAAGAPVVSAETSGESREERLVEQSVTGTVVAYTKRSLSIEVSRSEGGAIQEMLLPVDPKVATFERLAGMSDLQRGDRVRVEYRQRFQKTAENEYRLAWSEATKISLLARGMSGPRPMQSTPEGGGS